jgi:hypothetical protein
VLAFQRGDSGSVAGHFKSYLWWTLDGVSLTIPHLPIFISHCPTKCLAVLSKHTVIPSVLSLGASPVASTPLIAQVAYLFVL